MWFLLLACDGSDPQTEDPGDGVERLTSNTTDTPPDDPRTSDELFTQDVIHTVDITLDDDAWDGLYVDPYTFVSGDVRVDGDLVPGSGVRLRGKYGSFRTITGKPKFKIAFDEYDGAQRYLGMKALALNNEVVDCSFLKEPLGYEVFRTAGIPVPRTSFASVTVNGEDYGLYVLVEVPDDVFLERHYADASGNLYDGKYLYFPGYGSGYTLLDFASGLDDQFPLEEGTDVDNVDVSAVSSVIVDGTAAGTYTDTVGALVDLPYFHHYEAAEQWIGHVDGYALNQNNYRFYFDPQGKMQFIPWDFDYAFYQDYEWGMSWENPRGKLAAGCWANPDCRADQAEAVRALADAVDPDALIATFDAWDALTIELAQDDPRRECRRGQVPGSRDALRDWVRSRNEAVVASWD